MELLLWGVYVFCGVCSIKCRHGVPVLICVSGRAGGGVWVRAGVRTQSEGKGPANAEWQLIMPHRYISICPPAQYLPLRAHRHGCCWTLLGKTQATPLQTFCCKTAPRMKTHQTEVTQRWKSSYQITTSVHLRNISAHQHTKKKNKKKIIMSQIQSLQEGCCLLASSEHSFLEHHPLFTWVFMPLTGFKIAWILLTCQTFGWDFLRPYIVSLHVR